MTFEDCKTFAGLLAFLLNRRGISQRELGTASGVHYVTINRLVNGQYLHTLTGATVEALAAHLNCSAPERVKLYQLAALPLPELMVLFMREHPALVHGLLEYWEQLLERR